MRADTPVTILIAEDDLDDRLLTKEALVEARLSNDLRFVGDGDELLDYLRHRGHYRDPASSPRPGLILLDLNMPRKDGRETLRELKSDPDLRHIPVIVLTTSRSEGDVRRCYELGGNSYITKPTSFNGLVETLIALGKYWLEIAELPLDGAEH